MRKPAPRLWWEQTSDYWDLPFYADLGLCCDVYGERRDDPDLTARDDEMAGREQLWAIRELGEEEGQEQKPDNSVLDKLTGGTE